ncbi:MAG: M20/M25/M40 family metallo-hydrolase, partial [Pseudomonadota bacterium]
IALAGLVERLSSLGRGGALDDDFRLATVTHVSVGEPTFGIAPGEGRLFVTLRASKDEALENMDAAARAMAEEAAHAHGLAVSFEVWDHFSASINDAEAAKIAVKAMDALGIAHSENGLPMRASEDFGVFGWNAKAAMLCLGPGEDHPALHNPDYDFPDDLIPIGAAIFERIARDITQG